MPVAQAFQPVRLPAETCSYFLEQKGPPQM